MTDIKDRFPTVPELYIASLIATALVYVFGVVILTILVMATSDPGDWPHLAGTMALQGAAGSVIATFGAFTLIAPMGTLFALIMLRVSPPRWWQGPLTGVLVALALEGLVLGLFNQGVVRPTLGNAATMSLPVVLAFFAGGFVQRRILDWPHSSTAVST